MSQAKPSAKWQLRLPPGEDQEVEKLAAQRGVSKNDIVRHALRLLLRIEQETHTGGRLMVKRSDKRHEVVEIWHIW